MRPEPKREPRRRSLDGWVESRGRETCRDHLDLSVLRVIRGVVGRVEGEG